jgi:hypothetical protein
MVRIETATVSVAVERAAMAAGVVVKEAMMVKTSDCYMAASVVREAGNDQSQALSLQFASLFSELFKRSRCRWRRDLSRGQWGH